MASSSCGKGFKTKRVSHCRLHLFPPMYGIREGCDLPSFGVFFPANFTRFYIIARSINGQLPSAPSPYIPCSRPITWTKGLLRIREQQSYDPSPGPTTIRPRLSIGTRRVNLASLLSAMDLQICRLDRRPIIGVKPFTHVYIVEVDNEDQSVGSADDSPITPDSAVAIKEYGRGTTDLQSNGRLVRLEGDGKWVSRLREAAKRVVEAGGDAQVLGCW